MSVSLQLLCQISGRLAKGFKSFSGPGWWTGCGDMRSPLHKPCILRNQAKSHETTQFTLYFWRHGGSHFPSASPQTSRLTFCFSVCTRAGFSALSLLWKLGLYWYCLFQGASALTIPGGMRSRASGVGLLQVSCLHRMDVDQHRFLFFCLFCTLGKQV